MASPATALMEPDAVPVEHERPRRIKATTGVTDRLFRLSIRGAALVVLTIMVLVGLFLFGRAGEALGVAGLSFFTTQSWEPGSHHFGILAVLTGTLLIAAVAVVVAVPLSTAVALYITEYAPRRLKRTFVSLVDLMAAVPSVVFGIVGAFFLQPNIVGLERWLNTYLGWIPVFAVNGAEPTDPLAGTSVYTKSTFIAGVVVGVMITPLISSLMREAFSQAPIGEREGALALGSTRWGMIRAVVLPFGKGGMIGGTMLGLGRALGETIAVYMIISPSFVIQPHILQHGANSVSALIALRYGEATRFPMSALMAAGLTLFVLTLAVNFGASSIVARSRSGASSEA